MNTFLLVWLAAWTVACGFLVRAYVTGERMADGTTTPLWGVLAFVIPWFFVACLLLYFNFARKTFRLGEKSLRVETRLLFASWNWEIPRDTITKIRQVKDGGEDDDSFHSWGLKIDSAASIDGLLHRILHINNFRRSTRSRSLLFRLPYEHSEWLGIVIARWADVDVELCRKP
jgi:hypothetical protein